MNFEAMAESLRESSGKAETVYMSAMKNRNVTAASAALTVASISKIIAEAIENGLKANSN